MKALALAAMMLAYTTTAGAVAWKAEGYYHFWMEVEQIGFKGEALLEYSGRLTPALIEEGINNEGAWFNFEIKHGLRGWDRVNDGPWVPLIPPPGGFSPTVFLDVDDFCNPAEYEDCGPPGPTFLRPAGAWNWDDWGQFNFIRADGVGGYAQFSWGGKGYYCDWDSYNGTCESSDGYFDFNYDWKSFGTFHEVPEPTLPALLGFGLLWLIASHWRTPLKAR
jgi:hypothetical protein